MTYEDLSPIRHRKIVFLTLCIGFLVGIGTTNIFFVHSWIILCILVLCGIQTIILFSGNKMATLFLIIGLFFGYFISLSHSESIENRLSLLSKITQDFSISLSGTGEILSLQKITPERKTYLLKLSSLWDSQLQDINLLIYTPTNSKIETGDVVSFAGKIEKIPLVEDFNYQKYLLLKSVFATSEPKQTRIVWNTLSGYNSFLISTKKWLIKEMNLVYPPDTASFLWGLLIWERQSLSKDVDDDFKNSGLSHIVAVSGFNITILIIFFTFLFQYFPKWVRLGLITLVVIVFIGLVGDQISALRAAIMWLVWYYCISFGKKTDLFNVLIATVVFFVVLEPLTLNYDISFHLSFLAVLGMMYTTDFFSKTFVWMPKFWGLRESLVGTFWALAFTLPISLVNFGQISLLSPIANLLTVPLLPLTMLLGFGSVLLNSLSHFLGVWIGFLGWWLLTYILSVAHYFWGLSWSLLIVDFWTYKYVFMFFYYGILCFLLLYFKKNDQKKIELI